MKSVTAEVNKIKSEMEVGTIAEWNFWSREQLHGINWNVICGKSGKWNKMKSVVKVGSAMKPVMGNEIKSAINTDMSSVNECEGALWINVMATTELKTATLVSSEKFNCCLAIPEY